MSIRDDVALILLRDRKRSVLCEKCGQPYAHSPCRRCLDAEAEVEKSSHDEWRRGDRPSGGRVLN